MSTVLHFIIRWTWVKSTTRRAVQAVRAGKSNFSPAARFNIALDLVTAVSFLLAAISGIAFGTAAFAHFVIHWGWVRKVTLGMLRLITQPVHREHSVRSPVHTSQ